MRKLIVFNTVSLDGYFVDIKGDMSWAHNENEEWNSFVADNAKGGGTLLFGRVTYDLMKSFWPTPFAIERYPVVAEQMNKRPKIVFSRTMDKASWNNTKLVKKDIAAEVRRMKNESCEGLVILGSGSIVAQLSQERLIDEYQFVVNPIILGGGRTMFEGLTNKISLKLKNTRSFTNGNVLLCYELMP